MKKLQLPLILLSLITPFVNANYQKIDTVYIETLEIRAYRHTLNLLEIAGNIGYIGEQSLRRETGLEAIQQLNYVPGIYIHQGAINTNRMVLRGIGSRSAYSSNRVKMFWNDIPLSTNDGQSNFEDFEPSFARKLEIIKGPASALYGANLGGVLCFESDTNKQHRYQFGYSGGSFNTHRAYATINFRPIQLGVTHEQSNGYRDNSNYTKTNGFLQFHKHIKKFDFSALQLLNQLHAYIPSSVNKETFENEPTKAATSWEKVKGNEKYYKWVGGMKGTYNLNSSFSFSANVYWQWSDGIEVRPFNTLDDQLFNRGATLQTIYKKKSNNLELNLTTGLRGQIEDYNYEVFAPQSLATDSLIQKGIQHRQSVDGFTLVQIKFYSGLLLDAGLNINSTKYTYPEYFGENESSNTDIRFKTLFSPRLAANYTINKHHSVYVNLSQGFSPPTFEESLNSEGKLNPDLQPETGWNYESGYRGLIRPNLFFEFCAFYMNINNLLTTLRISEDQFSGTNSGSSIHKGIESRILYTFTLGKIRSTIELGGSLASYKFNKFVSDSQNYSGNVLPGVPSQNFYTKLNCELSNHFCLVVDWRYTGDMFLNDQNSEKSSIYQVLDIRGEYQWKGITIFASGRNLFNEKYASMLLVNAVSFGNATPRYYYPALPINFTVGFNVKIE